MRWLDEEGLLQPVAPAPSRSCRRCFGAVGARDGRLFDHCPQCGPLRSDPLDGFVPVLYTTDGALESMLHSFKDWHERGLADHTWLKIPLGCILADFWGRHAACVDQFYGRFDLVLAVPSDNRTRRYSQLSLINELRQTPTLDLVEGVVMRDFTQRRPPRRGYEPGAYVVPDPRLVAGRAILLVDDTWTTGATLRSTAGALKLAGAASVVAFTLGRQLSPGFGNSADLLHEIGGRSWSATCVLCA
ncbi:ComF family protein [Cellulomonas fengjieae]|uniref:Phosphoribosyltransferase domain-containing protein n=1 Tax=Cellulomonas fengjieae TaxID=2819978 RepID=A0ABS3SEC8_9CELL|nr:hypothetical protein [Cellulomonas fengjieae]MBO3084102.1 hypothetical protein [Cellulomonas fengjieae]QVI64643.1 hypothetical protein KG102_10645 [Cellulomonas fengjieae]